MANAIPIATIGTKEVLNAIERKLREHPEITLQCLFNHPVPNPLSSKFEGEHQVDLRSTGLEDSAPRDVRMIVIDDGRMTYSTRYKPSVQGLAVRTGRLFNSNAMGTQESSEGVNLATVSGSWNKKFSEASET